MIYVIGWSGIGWFSITPGQDCQINVQSIVIISYTIFIVDVLITALYIYYFKIRLEISKFDLRDPKISFPLSTIVFNSIILIMTGTYIVAPNQYEQHVVGNSIWYTLLYSLLGQYFIGH